MTRPGGPPGAGSGRRDQGAPVGRAALVRRAVVLVAIVLVTGAMAAGCAGGRGPREEAAGDDPVGGATAPADADGSVAADAAPVPSAACAHGGATAVDTRRRTVVVDGVERWYLLTVPGGLSGPGPLVLDFHGLTEGASRHAGYSGFVELAGREGFVVVQPNGSGPLVSWSVDPTAANPDARFVEAILDQLGAEVCLDLSRVYAAGISNGALLSSALGCSHAPVLAAVAPVAGVAFPEGCRPAVPVPLITFHGTADPILLFNGGVGSVLSELLSGRPVTPTTPAEADLDGPGYPAAAASWAAANGCGQPADEASGDTLVHRVWDCPRGAATEMWIVLGGGHTWPGSDGFTGGLATFLGSTNREIDATALAWGFFRSQRREIG